MAPVAGRLPFRSWELTDSCGDDGERCNHSIKCKGFPNSEVKVITYSVENIDPSGIFAYSQEGDDSSATGRRPVPQNLLDMCEEADAETARAWWRGYCERYRRGLV